MKMLLAAVFFVPFKVAFLKKMENEILAHGKMSKRTKDVQYNDEIYIALPPILRFLLVTSKMFCVY